MKPLWRALVFVAGFLVVLGGVVMLVTPGPGLAAMLLGLTILATEFRWARFYLVVSKRRALAAARRVRHRLQGRKGRPEAPLPAVGEPNRAGSAAKPAIEAREGD